MTLILLQCINYKPGSGDVRRAAHFLTWLVDYCAANANGVKEI